MKKFIIALLLAGMLCSLSACGTGGDGSDTAATDSTSVAETDDIKEGTNMNILLNEDGKGTLSVGSGEAKVDFSTRSGNPLFKRNSCCVSGSSGFYRLTPYLTDLRCRSARFSVAIDGSGTEEATKSFAKQMMTTGVGVGKTLSKYTTPFWHMAFVNAAIPSSAALSDPDNAKWYEPDYSIANVSWEAFAEYMADNGFRCMYEVWNEPDQPFWTFFDWDGYIRLYKNMASSLRAGDEDAFVGGPAMSDIKVLGNDKYLKFLGVLSDENIPLDFLSLHYYYAEDVSESLDIIREGLLDSGDFKTTQIIYSEFNIHNPAMGEWNIAESERTDYSLQKSLCSARALNTLQKLNSYTDVTQIQWAWLNWENGAFALIDNHGRRTPLYHTLYLYQHMPVESVKAESGSDKVGIMASADSTCAGVFLWNNDEGRAQSVEIALDNIPFDSYTVTVYRIDVAHSSWYETNGSDELEAVFKAEVSGNDTLVWNGKIPAGGSVYIDIDTGATRELEDHVNVGTVIRTDSYFADRTQNSYSDFDPLTSCALIGTGSDNGRGLCAVTYRNLNESIKVTSAFSGNITDADGANLYMRADYHTSDGYTKSVVWAQSYSGEESFPFGTGRAADKVIMADMTDFTPDISGNAPDLWDGQVIISFDIYGAGASAEAKIKLK